VRKMKTCARCEHCVQVAGGSQLVNFCKEKNEPVEFPTIMGRFCNFFKEVEDNKKKKSDALSKFRASKY